MTGVAVRRTATPRWVHTLRFMARGRALVSPRAELELDAPLLLGRKTSISAFTQVSTAAGPVEIGARTDIGTGCSILGHPGGLFIGDDCLISPNAVIGAATLDATADEARPTRVGNNVWIGAGAVIMAGAEIAEGVIVSPNSVVSGVVTANAIVQGNPSKIIFTRR